MEDLPSFDTESEGYKETLSLWQRQKVDYQHVTLNDKLPNVKST